MCAELLLVLLQAASEILVRSEKLAQAYEGAHDVDRYFGGARAVESRNMKSSGKRAALRRTYSLKRLVLTS